MTVLKLSKSGKQLQVIDDFGNVYGIGVYAVRNLLDGKVANGVTVASRLPDKVSPDRFGVSPLWDPEGRVPKETLLDSSINLNNDALSPKALKRDEDFKKFEDKVVW